VGEPARLTAARLTGTDPTGIGRTAARLPGAVQVVVAGGGERRPGPIERAAHARGMPLRVLDLPAQEIPPRGGGGGGGRGVVVA
jgi:hypothetical protein